MRTAHPARLSIDFPVYTSPLFKNCPFLETEMKSPIAIPLIRVQQYYRSKMFDQPHHQILNIPVGEIDNNAALSNSDQNDDY